MAGIHIFGKIKQEKNAFRGIVAAGALIFLYGGCAPKIYHPPPLGAEYRFDEGLKPEKHPKQLFDKKTQKYLEEKGQAHSSAGRATIPAPTANPKSSDSSRTVQH